MANFVTGGADKLTEVASKYYNILFIHFKVTFFCGNLNKGDIFVDVSLSNFHMPQVFLLSDAVRNHYLEPGAIRFFFLEHTGVVHNGRHQTFPIRNKMNELLCISVCKSHYKSVQSFWKKQLHRRLRSLKDPAFVLHTNTGVFFVVFLHHRTVFCNGSINICCAIFSSIFQQNI